MSATILFFTGTPYRESAGVYAVPITSSGVTSGFTAPADDVTTKLATRLADRSVAPIHELRGNPSQAAAVTGVYGSEPSALSFDPAFLAAWRESQGQPTDAEPRSM